MKYFFGVTSKNQVDSIIEFSLAHKEIDITFIPSRRQVEYNGGYVNNWTTQEFSFYVKNLNPLIKIERDENSTGSSEEDDWKINKEIEVGIATLISILN